MEMSVFLKDGDKYTKRESVITEYIHKTERLKEILCKVGFKILTIDGDMGEYSESSHRVNITAIKE